MSSDIGLTYLGQEYLCMPHVYIPTKKDADRPTDRLRETET